MIFFGTCNFINSNNQFCLFLFYISVRNFPKKTNVYLRPFPAARHVDWHQRLMHVQHTNTWSYITVSLSPVGSNRAMAHARTEPCTINSYRYALRTRRNAHFGLRTGCTEPMESHYFAIPGLLLLTRVVAVIYGKLLFGSSV